MINLKTIFLLFFSLTIWNVKANTNDLLAKLEQQMVDEYLAMVQGDLSEQESRASSFKIKMFKMLSNEKTVGYTFNELSKYIKILQSPDSMLKVFSWDEANGGRWHDMSGISQYVDENGELYTQMFNTSNSAIYGSYNDVIYHKVNVVNLNNEDHYALFGVGFHSPSSKFETVEFYQKTESGIKKRKNIFRLDPKDDPLSTLGIEAQRGANVDLAIDNDNTISFNDFKLTEKGEFIPSGKRIELTFTNGFYRPK